jgi:hypothetical protein
MLLVKPTNIGGPLQLVCAKGGRVVFAQPAGDVGSAQRLREIERGFCFLAIFAARAHCSMYKFRSRTMRYPNGRGLFAVILVSYP